MARYALGDVIYHSRIRKKITQEELCYGICTTATLSRIENGGHMPRRKTYEALMQRLGLSVQPYMLPVNKDELERSNLEYQIFRKISMTEYDYEELLEQYQTCGAEMDHIEQQFYLHAKACRTLRLLDHPQEALELYIQALKKTMPDFSFEKLRDCRVLTFDEMRIINCMASIYYRQGECEKGKGLLLYLKDYLENNEMDMEEKAKFYPMILFNLSNWFGIEGRVELAYDMCNEGIDFCIKYGKLTVFPCLILNKAYSLAKMNRVDEAIPYFRQACTIFEALKDNERADLCRKEIKKDFSIDI